MQSKLISKLLLISVLLIGGISMGACGQKGPLYLPSSPSPENGQ